MTTLEFTKRAMGWVVATSAALVSLAVALYLLWKTRRESQRHARRLGAEIVDVAASIELDLRNLQQHPATVIFGNRCTECRARAEQVVSSLPLSSEALTRAAGELHDDHRRIVELRSELDMFIASLRRGQLSAGESGGRAPQAAGTLRWSGTRCFPTTSIPV